MRHLRVVPYPHSKTSPWCISGLRQNGKRKRLFFATKTDALAELARIKIKLRREGQEALELPDWLRVAALACTKRLRAYPGKTIVDATDHYIKYLEDSQKSCTVSKLMTEFLASQKKAKRSARHQRDLKARLGRFCEDFGSEPVRTVQLEKLERWLPGLGLGATSLNNFRGRISSMFSWGLKRHYLDSNPMAAIDKVKTVDIPPEIFTPEGLRLVLENADREAVPLIVIGAFAGLRTSELLRLEWKDIDLAIRKAKKIVDGVEIELTTYGNVKVEALKSKSAKRRVVAMSQNLNAWLSLYGGRTGALWQKSETVFYDETEKAWKAAHLAKWPKNGLRHSFASYHLAKHNDAARLALDMGHTTTKMIFANYRDVVTPEEAERYWQIYPPTRAENVVPMAASC
jgi:integrase